MKLMNKKYAKYAKIFTVLFTIAVVTSLGAVTDSQPAAQAVPKPHTSPQSRSSSPGFAVSA